VRSEWFECADAGAVELDFRFISLVPGRWRRGISRPRSGFLKLREFSAR
jgi:hypothetical protein